MDNIVGMMCNCFHHFFKNMLWAPIKISSNISLVLCISRSSQFHVLFQGTFRTVKEWIHELRKNGTVDMVIAIAGNKCDLEDLREVRTKGLQNFCTAR